MTAGVVYISGAFASPSGIARQFSDDGTPQWTAETTSGYYICTTDHNGNLYVVSGETTVKKYDIDGTELWSRTYGFGQISAIAVDLDDNVYTASAAARKHNSSGTLLWSHSHGAYLDACCVDTAGHSYFAGAVASSVSIRSYEADGTARWTANHGAQVWGIDCDSHGDIYIAGSRTGGYTHRKYDTDGSLQWSKDHGAAVLGVFVDYSDAIYFCGSLNTYTARKYAADGTQIWARAYHGANCYGICADGDGSVYITGAQLSTYSARKYDSTGDLQWSVDAGASARSVAFFATPIVITPAGLAIPLELAIPESVVMTVLPGLALPLALALPTGTPAASPQDTPGVPQPVYRGYVSGGDPLEIPIISIQCRRRRGDSTWVSVQTAYSVARWAALTARLAVGAELLIHAGYRVAGGGETLGQFLRATLTDVVQERTIQTAHITLTARVNPTAYTLSSRSLYGVTRRGKADGQRTARCAVIDPLLRPGDIIDDGLTTWEVGAILYFIGAAAAYMDVTEDV